MSINNLKKHLPEIKSILYPKCEVKLPHENKKNIFMGIGLWSKAKGLSIGLPVDIMPMLLSSVVLRQQIKDKATKIYILIPDSLAINDGADKSKVSVITKIYKESLLPLLNLLNINDCSEIILSSELQKDKEYEGICNLTRSKYPLNKYEKYLKTEDSELSKKKEDIESQYKYLITQTSVVHYMYKHKNVGVKIGWIYTNSRKYLSLTKEDIGKKLCQMHWDELKFDIIYQSIYTKSALQCIYSIPGIKRSMGTNPQKRISAKECCPYTAYEDGHRYLLKATKPASHICRLTKSLWARWKKIAFVCSILKENELVKPYIIPNNLLTIRNDMVIAYIALHAWMISPTQADNLLKIRKDKSNKRKKNLEKGEK